ncbi:hypothetical protein BD626DRAFT_493901 [Schizophyllum amplum]|uniref:Uncharacterized protein n=1 Tax=Schizophyllum amplum TaxID=97359 RepID=A0A550CH48_9AGAR|nr:hypothetical protein BD626DRAFT_493901 [Auriculariopsis ampla]
MITQRQVLPAGRGRHHPGHLKHRIEVEQSEKWTDEPMLDDRSLTRKIPQRRCFSPPRRLRNQVPTTVPLTHAILIAGTTRMIGHAAPNLCRSSIVRVNMLACCRCASAQRPLRCAGQAPPSQQIFIVYFTQWHPSIHRHLIGCQCPSSPILGRRPRIRRRGGLQPSRSLPRQFVCCMSHLNSESHDHFVQKLQMGPQWVRFDCCSHSAVVAIDMDPRSRSWSPSLPSRHSSDSI